MSEIRDEIKIPKHIFIVPYRNRAQQKFFFSKYMSFLLEDKKDYEIYFSHQSDLRSFNRGATRNIGFLAIKNKYPEHYRDMNIIFNDVDTIPFNKIFSYETKPGVVKHYYGFNYALGGIVVIKGGDFEKINGYPCFWGWGMEDACLQKRCERNGLLIDRNEFYNIGSPEILQLFDGISRMISKKDHSRMQKDDGFDGIRTIHKLSYTIDEKSTNQDDNVFSLVSPRIFYINIKTFLTHLRFEDEQYFSYDLREPKRKMVQPDKFENVEEVQNLVSTTNNWTKIPYYPTMKERRENVALTLLSQGKQLPPALIKQIEQDRIAEHKSDNFNKNVLSEEQMMCAKEMIYQARSHSQPQYRQPQQYNSPKTAHLFSKEYRRNQPTMSKPSARIGLGGVF
jgi:hypothetical protein